MPYQLELGKYGPTITPYQLERFTGGTTITE
jgi:hypothetical protein